MSKQCTSCRSTKKADSFFKEGREFKSCDSCRNYQIVNRVKLIEARDPVSRKIASKKYYEKKKKFREIEKKMENTYLPMIASN